MGRRPKPMQKSTAPVIVSADAGDMEAAASMTSGQYIRVEIVVFGLTE